jgi:hypothetical protein
MLQDPAWPALASLTNRSASEAAPADHVIRFFAYFDLPPSAQVVARPFAELAQHVLGLPRNPERTKALNKLLEAKDAALRALVAK